MRLRLGHRVSKQPVEGFWNIDFVLTFVTGYYDGGQYHFCRWIYNGKQRKAVKRFVHGVRRSPHGLHVVVVVVALDVVAVMVVVVMVGNEISVAVVVVVVRLGVLYFSGIYAVMINDRWRSSTMISLL